MLGRGAQERCCTARPLDVQVRRVLPGVADAAVDLDVAGRRRGVGRAAHGGRGRGEDLQVALSGVECASGGPSGRPTLLDADEEVGELVFDGLEGSDGSAELDPLTGIRDRLVERSLRPAGLFPRTRLV